MGGDEGPIEIHFIDEVLPGYFWLYLVQGNRVNVRIGMLILEHRKLKKVGKKKTERRVTLVLRKNLLPRSEKG